MLGQAGAGARLFGLCLIPFIVLATLNAGGYRYGASDQAFYIPAILEQLDPALFPRDGVVLGAQTKLTIIDELIAAIVRATGASLPAIFALLYLLSLALGAAGAWLIARRLYASTWTAMALLAALTLRHAIARSGTNTLEGYFHPRVLAYGLGALAIAFFLRRSLPAVGVLLLAGAAVHPTTAVWFGVWLAVAIAIAEPAYRKGMIALFVAGAAIAGWAVLAGPLAGRLTVMDDEWRALLASKNYLFPLQWPAYAWIINLGYLPVIVVIHRQRMAAGLVDERERALVVGSSVLLAIFVVALICHAIGIALSFQLQPARVFWMFDFLAVVHAVWWLSEGRPARVRPRRVQLKPDAANERDFRLKPEATTGETNLVASGFSRKPSTPAAVALVLAALSLARGVYVLYEADRPPVQLTIADDDWGRVMAWARSSDKTSGWLAHPLHAVLYGTSVRVAGERDVFVEAVKDAAIGMYDRAIAVRTEQRLRQVTTFEQLTVAQARRLATEYDLDYLVTTTPLELPLVFRSGELRVYRLE